MRAVIQRVSRASVAVDGRVAGSIERGLLALVAVGSDDGPDAPKRLAVKVAKLRIFPDEAGKMNRNIVEAGGRVLTVSQFTLYGDTRGGNRPSFIAAAAPEKGRALFEAFVSELAALGLRPETGVFGARMAVELVNDGPVTIIIDEP